MATISHLHRRASAEQLLLFLARMYPLHKGRGRLALSSLLRSKTTEGGAPLLVRLASGEHIYVFANDYIGRMVRFFGDLDPAISAVVRRIVRRGDVVLDVGANVGIVTLQAASIVGPDGHVFAFEPVARLAALLERSAGSNHLHNITVQKLALSDVRGRGCMQVPARSLGCSSLSTNDDGEPCEIRLLDDIDFGPRFKRPRLLKIDVEGHESQVLAGGRAFLEHNPPDYVLFESHADRGAFWHRPEVKLLQNHGYRFSAILRTIFAEPKLREIGQSDLMCGGCYDFLATKQGEALDV